MNNFSKYLLSSTLEEDWGFYITTAGFTKIDINQSYPPNSQHPENHKFNWDTGRILDGYYLVFISRGEGVFESAETKSTNIKEGTCFLLFPGVWHRYKPHKEIGWEEYWVGFKGAYPDMLRKNFDPASPFIQTGKNDALLKLFLQLLENIQQASPGYHQVISGIVLQMLGIIQAVSHYDLNSDKGTQLIEEAKFLLRESIQQPDKIENIVNRLPIGYSKFRKEFKRATGQSPNQYQLNLRLDKAKGLLTGTTLSISEIAYQTGFESVFYFSRFFKQKNGTSPRAYRN